MPELLIEPIHQGRTNGCGTAALAMTLNYLAGQSPGTIEHAFTQHALDEQVRQWDSFSAPGLLLKAAQREGFYGNFYNNATLEAVKSHLDRDCPVLALINVNRTIQGLHYVVIHGYEDAGGQSNLIITDPASAPGRQRQVIRFDEFSRRYWERLAPPLLPTGLNRPMLVFSPRQDLPPGSPPPMLLCLADGLGHCIQALGGLRKRTGWFPNVSESDCAPALRFFTSERT